MLRSNKLAQPDESEFDDGDDDELPDADTNFTLSDRGDSEDDGEGIGDDE